MESNFKRAVGGACKANTTLRPSIRIGAGLAVLACVISLIACLCLNRAPKPSTQSSDLALISPEGSSDRDASSGSRGDPGQAANLRSSTDLSPPAQPTGSVSRPEATLEARRLVTAVVRMEPAAGVLTKEQAAAWKQSLQDLVAQRPAGVLAIREFLAQNREYAFAAGAQEMLGYGSARTALFGALAEIGGAEAVNAMTDVLQTSADPREIALLAQDLEKLEPGQHRQEVLDAARQTLEMASERKLEIPDAAPLFEVLQKFGGPAVVSDLERATGQWNFYGTIALAQLPDDAGIPTLVQLAQDPKTAVSVRDATLQMLAQVSDRSPDARATLLALGKMNQLSLFTWQMVASALAGDQVGLLNSAFEDHQALAQINGLRTVATSDNQNFFALPGTLTPEQVNQHIALIDDLLASTSDPNARQVLQQSKTLLGNRLPRSPLAAAFGQ